jgi:hypothetical protein
LDGGLTTFPQLADQFGQILVKDQSHVLRASLSLLDRRILVHGQLQVGKRWVQLRLGDHQQAIAVEDQRHRRGIVVAGRGDLIGVAAQQAPGSGG